MIEKIKALCVKYREFLVYFIVGCLTTLVAAAARFGFNFLFFGGTLHPTFAQNLCVPHEPQMGLSEQEPEHPRRGGRICRFASRNAWDGLGGHAAARHGAGHKRICDVVHKVCACVPRQLYPQQALCFQKEKRRIKKVSPARGKPFLFFGRLTQPLFEHAAPL